LRVIRGERPSLVARKISRDAAETEQAAHRKATEARADVLDRVVEVERFVQVVQVAEMRTVQRRPVVARHIRAEEIGERVISTTESQRAITAVVQTDPRIAR
jgi:hypothetical protein